jgi:SSS family solute:Na+ symporter
MSVRLGIVLGYLLALLVIAVVFRRVSSRNRVEFFLAGRNVPGALLFFTMAATNFSAFTIFGLSGAGYRPLLARCPHWTAFHLKQSTR